MPVKGTIFDQFTQNAYDFQGSLSKLINTFLSAIGNDILNTNVLGNINLNSIIKLVTNPSAAISGLETSLQADIMKGINQFKQMASDSLVAVYNSALGFSENVVNSYMAALISQIYCPEDVFLWTVQQMYEKGSNQDMNNTLRDTCYKHDLYQTIAWLDQVDNTSYTIFETAGIEGGITASKLGSFNVAMYVMGRIKKSMEEYSYIPLPQPTDTTYNTAKQKFTNDMMTYNYYIHLIAKNIFVYSYSNLTPGIWAQILQNYNIDPQAFGTTDKMFGGACTISMNEINILAPFFVDTYIAASQGTIYQINENSYINPPNSHIKFLFLYMYLPTYVGQNNVIVHQALYTRLSTPIISTYLKSLLDASSSLITTGLGAFVNTAVQDIKALISNFSKAMDSYLFDPSKQTYIVTGDNPVIPPPSTSSSSSGTSPGTTVSSVNSANMLGNIDVRNFRIYTFNRLPGENETDPISNDEFNNRIVQMIYNITSTGKYTRYDIFSTTKRTRIFNSNGVFSGSYNISTEDFYVFSTYAATSVDPILSLLTFQTLTIKYLLDNYGIEQISYLEETYPDLPFSSFISQYLSQIQNSSVNYGDGSLPGSQYIIQTQTDAQTLQQLWNEYNAAIASNSQSSQQIASLELQVSSLQSQLAALVASNSSVTLTAPIQAQIQAAQNQIATLTASQTNVQNIQASIQTTQDNLTTDTNNLVSSIETITSPGSLTISDGTSYYTALDSLNNLFENGYVTSPNLISSITSLQSSINALLTQAGLYSAVELNSVIIKLLNILPTVSSVNQEVTLLLTQLIQDLEIVIGESKPNSISNGLIQQLQAIISLLILLDPLTPNNNQMDNLSATIASLNASMNDLILMETNSSIMLKGRFLASKTLVLSRSQSILRAFNQLIVLPPTTAVKDALYVNSRWNSVSNDIIALIDGTFSSLETYIPNSTDVSTVENLKQTYINKITSDLGTISSFLNSSSNITLINSWDQPTLTNLFNQVRALMNTDFDLAVTQLFDSALDSIVDWGSPTLTQVEALYSGLQVDLMNIGFSWTDSIDTNLQNVQTGAQNLITSIQSAFSSYTSESTYYNSVVSSLPAGSSSNITDLLSSLNAQILVEIQNIVNSVTQYISNGNYSSYITSNTLSLQEYFWSTLL